MSSRQSTGIIVRTGRIILFFFFFCTSREVFVSAVTRAQREVDVPYTYKWARDPNVSARTKTIKQTTRRTPGHVSSRRPNRWRNDRNTRTKKEKITRTIRIPLVISFTALRARKYVTNTCKIEFKFLNILHKRVLLRTQRVTNAFSCVFESAAKQSTRIIHVSAFSRDFRTI